jgi:hypothetical protein
MGAGGRGVAVLHHCWKKMFQLAPENGAGYSIRFAVPGDRSLKGVQKMEPFI